MERFTAVDGTAPKLGVRAFMDALEALPTHEG